MSLEEDDDGRFFDATGREVGTDQVQRGAERPAPLLNPRERYMDRPDVEAAPEPFARQVDLD